MALDTFEWPSPDNYTLAVENLRTLAIPDWLKEGEVERDTVQNIRTYTGAGLYTRTYKLKLEPSAESPSGWWMARCFCVTSQGNPPPDIRKRYPEISKFCNEHLLSVSALSYVSYVEDALTVPFLDGNTSWTNKMKVVPIVLTPFIDHALPLGTYIALHYNERERMEELCRAWLKMLREMREANMAHGDLDLTNVLVQESGDRLYLKLIDYDNMWIPALVALPQPESGHEAFQHPTWLAKKSRPYNAQMDRFAALSIYISIRALSFYPELYKECKADDTHRLLFSQEDYRKERELARSAYLIANPSDMGNIAKLRSKNNPALLPYLSDFSYSLAYDCMPNYNVYDIPPYLGEFTDMTQRATVAPQDMPTATTTGATPTPTPASRATSRPGGRGAKPPSGPRRVPTVRAPRHLPPRRRGIPAGYIWAALIIIAIIITIIIVVAIVHAHTASQQPHHLAWPLLLSELHRWHIDLPSFVERGIL